MDNKQKNGHDSINSCYTESQKGRELQDKLALGGVIDFKGTL